MFNRSNLGGANRSAAALRKSIKGNDKVMSKMLKDEIKESKATVERIKRGFSLFDLDVIKKACADKS